jgi:small subunit ribosomal protein S15
MLERQLLLSWRITMARIHSRKRGTAGSTNPSVKTVPSWVSYKPKEIEMIISKLGKEGNTSSQIGIILRDSYGIPDVRTLLKKKVTAVLIDKKLAPEIPDDLMSVIRKTVSLRKHMEVNKQDQTARRGLMLSESKIKRLVKYYKSTEKLPLDWKYDAKSIRLLVE